MIKQMVVLSLMGVFLTGCIVAPYDDYSNRHDQRYEHKQDSGRWSRNDQHRWDNKRDNDRRDWNKNRSDRPDWNNR